MIRENSLRRAVVIELDHSSGNSTARILATEPGVYRLFAKALENVDSAIVSIGRRNEILEQSPGSRVRFTVGVPVEQLAASEAATQMPLEAA